MTSIKRKFRGHVIGLIVIMMVFSVLSTNTFALGGTLSGNTAVSVPVINGSGSTVVTRTIDAQNGISGTPTDVVLVLDRSGSIGASTMVTLKNAAKAFVDKLDEGSDGVLNGLIANGSRVGVVSFSSNASIDSALTSNAGTAKAAINSLVVGGTTNHDQAFQFAGNLLSTSTGNKVIVILTDGYTTAGANPDPRAATLRSQGTVIYSIGLGTSIDQNQLRDWATDPDAAHVYIAPNDSQLNSIFEAIGAAVIVPAATNAVLVDTVSDHFTVSNVSVNKGSFALLNNVITWNIGNLSTEQVVLTYTVQHDPAKADGVEYIDTNEPVYSDTEGQSLNIGRASVTVDGTAPVTALALVGTAGDNGWYASDVNAALSATDGPNPGATGVKQTQYEVNGAGFGIYASPFDLLVEGVNQINFFSEDNIGNVEAVNSQVVKIDKTPPVITVNTPADGGVYAKGLVLDFDAVDPVSGLNSLVAKLDNGDTVVDVVNGFVPEAGVYTLTLTAKDNAGNQSTKTVEFVVFDPANGFVTAGGRVVSPVGSLASNPLFNGEGNFGLNLKYKADGTLQGNTQFGLGKEGFNVSSTSHDWLVVSGNKAIYKGSATINNQGDYGFVVVLLDGATNKENRFRIKVWDKTTSQVLYDNELGVAINKTPTGGGTLLRFGSVIHHH